MDELFSSPDYEEFPASLHLAMLQDSIRMEIYSEAIRALVKPGDVVVDVGTGTGVLSFLAAKYGAGEIFAIDRSGIIDYAKKVKALNCPQAQIHFLQKNILDSELPKIQADIAICELFGNFGIDENVVNVLSKVRNDLLKPGGRIIPETMDLMVAPVQCTKSYRQVANWKNPEYEIDYSPFQQLAYNAVYQIHGEPVRMLAEPKVLSSIDFYTVKELEKELTTEFEFERSGIIHGIAGWFRSTLTPGYVLDTGPEAPLTHWGQVLFPIGDPLKVNEGGSLTMKFWETLINSESHWHWSGGIISSPQSTKNIQFSFTASRRFYND